MKINERTITVDKILKLRASNTPNWAGASWRLKDAIAETIANDIILHSFPEGLPLPTNWTYQDKVTYIAKQGLL